MLGPGEFFGEGCLAGQPVRMGSATATTGQHHPPRGQGRRWCGLLHQQHAMSDRFIAHMLARNIRIEEDLIDQLFNSSEKRLARTLLLLARYGKHDKPVRAVPPISQETLAEMVGTTRSRVNFFMKKFQRLGLHRLHRRPQGQQLAAHRRPARLVVLFRPLLLAVQIEAAKACASVGPRAPGRSLPTLLGKRCAIWYRRLGSAGVQWAGERDDEPANRGDGRVPRATQVPHREVRGHCGSDVHADRGPPRPPPPGSCPSSGGVVGEPGRGECSTRAVSLVDSGQQNRDAKSTGRYRGV